MSDHTNTPWALGVDGVGDIFDADNRSIAKTDAWNVSTHRTPRENRANAAFIVNAVNSHDALVKALKNARNCIDTLIVNSPDKKKRRNLGEFILEIDGALASIKELT
jgi:hypothetical protein